MIVHTSKLPKHKYKFTVYNGRIKIHIDGVLFLTYNQLDFKGLWAFKDDTNLYGINIYLLASDGPATETISVYFKTKKVWLEVLKLIDENI